VCNRWQKLAGGLRKHSGANRRPILSAGWLLAEGWLTMITCRTRKAEILKAEPGEQQRKAMNYRAMAEKLSA
jgi:hypothetical protein